jgi:carboxymethylenebutenolidase
VGVVRGPARRTGSLAILSAAGGLCLAAMTASVSPGLIMRLGAFAGAGVAAETPVLAQAAQEPPRAKDPVYRTMAAFNVSQLKLDGVEIWYYRKAPSGEGTWPALIVLHDGWGLTVPLQRALDALADQGFVVYAMDFNNRRVATDPDKAREMALLQDAEAVSEKASALLHYVKFLPEVGDHRVGLIGFDTGATAALRTAMRTDEVSALAVVYPPDPPPADALRRIPCPVLAIYGANDTVMPKAKVDAFQTALQEAGRTAEVKVYDGAGHGFMSPSDPGHDAAAAGDAWGLVGAFFRSHL